MGRWFFIPWTIQYIIGSVVAFIITVPIFLSNHKSWAYRTFAGFGLCTILWSLTAFFHRNAPSKELSGFFYGIDLFFGSLAIPFLLLMILFLWKEKFFYAFTLLPAIITGSYALIFSPFKIIWTNLGWSYVFFSPFNILFFITALGYNILCFIILLYLSKKIPLMILRKKYKIIIAGLSLFTVCYMIANILAQNMAYFPPLGGIFYTGLFIFIAAAISLKEDRIKLKLEDVYTRFLSGVFNAIPGKELGQNLIEFTNFIEYSGISKFVTVSGNSYFFDKSGFYHINLIEILKKNVQFLENREYKVKVFKVFRELFSHAYLFLYTESKEEIDKTIVSFIENHEKFLLESNALYNLGAAKFLEMITEDTILTGNKKHEQLNSFYEKLRLALNAYSKSLLDDSYRAVFDMKKKVKTDLKAVYMEYNVLFYDRYNYIRGKTVDFDEGFIQLTAQVLRLHNNITKHLPVIPVFFVERLLNELYSLFSGNDSKIAVHNLIKSDKSFKYLKISGNKIYFPCLDECFYRYRLIRMCKAFVKCLVEQLSEKTLKQFLYIMSKFAIPNSELIVEKGKICIIKNNINLGYILFDNFIKLGYASLYIGKEEGGASLSSKNSIFIERTSLLDELDYNNQISFNNLDGLLKIIRKHIKENTNTVVMLNSIDDLLYINSFNKVISFLKDILKTIGTKDARFIIPGNLLVLNEDEEKLLENIFVLLNKNNYYYNDG